jgi:arginyl-tRNA synthetase
LADIQDDLADFNVHFDQWFSEKSIQDAIVPALELLEQRGFLYQKYGNLWFKSTEFGDEKDRVVRRANGQFTYFASDIAYHKDKLDRGYDKIIDVWGSDHHGYIKRVKAALTAMGYDAQRMDVILVQFVTLWRGTEQIQMSSRSGQFVTLRELRQEVGNDAARFYYVARKPEQHIDFDLELAKSHTKDNAVYYIQYAHARICRVLERTEERGIKVDDKAGKAHQHLLTQPVETDLLSLLASYPEVLRRAAVNYEPHLLTNYLKDLASLFHGWYNDNRILPKDGETPTQDELDLMQARLRLSKSVRQVIQNGLILLGLTAPTSM